MHFQSIQVLKAFPLSCLPSNSIIGQKILLTLTMKNHSVFTSSLFTQQYVQQKIRAKRFSKHIK